MTLFKEVDAELRTQLERLNLLNRITRAVAEQHDMRTIFQVVVRSLEDHLPADFVCICLYDAESRTLTVHHVGIRNAPLARELGKPEHAQVSLGETILTQCESGAVAICEPDLFIADSPFLQQLALENLRAFAAAPMFVEKELLGVLIVARSRGAFDETDRDFLRQLCEHVALAANQARLHESLQKAYDDLRRTRQAAMQQERLRALGQMAGGIAHDINNAISPLALYTDSLLEQERAVPEHLRSYFTTVQRVVGEVSGTVARLDDFHREREQQTVFAAVDLNAMVQQVVELTRARWNDMPQRRGIVISLQCGLDKTSPSIMGAEHALREALTNLVFNAVDALPQGGTIVISTREESGRIHLDVSDDGVGMDEATRTRCVEPFFTTKGERGSGLGLATVYGIANRHQAEIDIDSAPERGTTFRMSFPLPLPEVPVQKEETVALRALRLLVVDDDPFVLESMRTVLERNGHAIETASGGREGIEAFGAALAKGERFSAVITDLGMPYVDGIQVARAVKLQSPATPIVLLTGWGRRMQSDSEAIANVDFFIGKPPKLEDLRRVLAQIPDLSN
jgi:signal transduction histidine kinase/ActR/RegA family two-component response regulator